MTSKTPSSLATTPCMIIAGGGSTRFEDGAKALAMLGGRPLLEHVIERLRAQAEPLALNAADAAPYDRFGLPVIADAAPGGLGPLGGLLAAMEWAQTLGATRVLTAPVDTPFLPADLLARLAEVGADRPAIATSLGRRHPICGLWPVALTGKLSARLDAGLRAARAWADEAGAATVDFRVPAGAPDPFFNINTREDLEAAAERL